MHLGRFHRAVELLHNEFKSINPVQLIQELVSALNLLAANPGSPEIANSYKLSLEKCRTTLASSSLNHPRPILKYMLESIGAEKYVGDKLFSFIRTAIATNPVAPSLAVQAISKIQQDTKVFYQNIIAIDSAFSNLGVEYDELDEGEAEIGLLVPRDPAASTLKDLSKEFNQWHNALAPIVEIFDSQAGPLQIKLCATSDWSLYLAATPAVLFGVSKCVKGINGILRELIETRSLIEKLIEKKRSPQAIEALEAEHAVMANHEIRALAEKIVDEDYKGDDAGRKNELKNALGQSLSTIAEKIGSGSQLEVRMLPPVTNATHPEGSDEAQADAANVAEMELLAQTFENEVEALGFDGKTDGIAALLGQSNSESDADN